MRTIVEIILLIQLIALGFYSSLSDLRHGIIENRVLLIFAAVGIITNSIYYGFCVRDIFSEYVISFLILTVIIMALYLLRYWAGGDLKLAMTMGLLVPAHWYVVINGTNITLYYALIIAFLLGTGYLVYDSLYGVLSGRNRVTSEMIRKGITGFLKSYLVVMTYMVAFDLIYTQAIALFIQVDRFWIILIEFAIAWLVTSNKWLSEVYVVTPLLCVNILACILLHIIPLSLNWSSYILAVVLAGMRILVGATNYIRIPMSSIQKGMILSSASSIIIKKLLPKADIPISTEKLDSRLTQKQAEIICNHPSSKELELMIVKRIPFAIFISLGFIIYSIWGVLSI